MPISWSSFNMRRANGTWTDLGTVDEAWRIRNGTDWYYQGFSPNWPLNLRLEDGTWEEISAFGTYKSVGFGSKWEAVDPTSPRASSFSDGPTVIYDCGSLNGKTQAGALHPDRGNWQTVGAYKVEDALGTAYPDVTNGVLTIEYEQLSSVNSTDWAGYEISSGISFADYIFSTSIEVHLMDSNLGGFNGSQYECPYQSSVASQQLLASFPYVGFGGQHETTIQVDVNPSDPIIIGMFSSPQLDDNAMTEYPTLLNGSPVNVQITLRGNARIKLEVHT